MHGLKIFFEEEEEEEENNCLLAWYIMSSPPSLLKRFLFLSSHTCSSCDDASASRQHQHLGLIIERICISEEGEEETQDLFIALLFWATRMKSSLISTDFQVISTPQNFALPPFLPPPFSPSPLAAGWEVFLVAGCFIVAINHSWSASASQVLPRGKEKGGWYR